MTISLSLIVIWKSDCRFSRLKRAHDTKVVHAMLNSACVLIHAMHSLPAGRLK